MYICYFSYEAHRWPNFEAFCRKSTTFFFPKYCGALSFKTFFFPIVPLFMKEDTKSSEHTQGFLSVLHGRVFTNKRDVRCHVHILNSHSLQLKSVKIDQIGLSFTLFITKETPTWSSLLIEFFKVEISGPGGTNIYHRHFYFIVQDDTALISQYSHRFLLFSVLAE